MVFCWQWPSWSNIAPHMTNINSHFSPLCLPTTHVWPSCKPKTIALNNFIWKHFFEIYTSNYLVRTNWSGSNKTSPLISQVYILFSKCLLTSSTFSSEQLWKLSAKTYVITSIPFKIWADGILSSNQMGAFEVKQTKKVFSNWICKCAQNSLWLHRSVNALHLDLLQEDKLQSHQWLPPSPGTKKYKSDPSL